MLRWAEGQTSLWSGSWRLTGGPEACLSEGGLRSEGGLQSRAPPVLAAAHLRRAAGGCPRPCTGPARPPPGAVDEAAAAPSARQRRGRTTRGLPGPGRAVSVGPLGWAWPGGGALPCMTSVHLAGHMVPAAGACAFVSLPACCWRSDFCWGAAHPFGPGSAQPTAGRKPTADSRSFRPEGSQCTGARRSCRPESWVGGVVSDFCLCSG